jgi:hypothetical protein
MQYSDKSGSILTRYCLARCSHRTWGCAGRGIGKVQMIWVFLLDRMLSIEEHIEKTHLIPIRSFFHFPSCIVWLFFWHFLWLPRQCKFVFWRWSVLLGDWINCNCNCIGYWMKFTINTNSFGGKMNPWMNWNWLICWISICFCIWWFVVENKFEIDIHHLILIRYFFAILEREYCRQYIFSWLKMFLILWIPSMNHNWMKFTIHAKWKEIISWIITSIYFDSPKNIISHISFIWHCQNPGLLIGIFVLCSMNGWNWIDPPLELISSELRYMYFRQLKKDQWMVSEMNFSNRDYWPFLHRWLDWFCFSDWMRRLAEI